jgi:Tfp pilus assembly protein PilE
MNFLKSKILNLKSNAGFSLMEIIIYITIFTIISIVVINAYITIFSSFSNTKTTRNLLESGNAVMERISREVLQSSSIDISNSILGSNPGVLQLNSTDSSGNSRVVKFGISPSATHLDIYYDGSLVGNLIRDDISVSSLVFRRIGTPIGEGVKVELTLQNNFGKTIRSEHFYNTIILRTGY